MTVIQTVRNFVECGWELGLGVIFIFFCVFLPFLQFVIFVIRKIIVSILYKDFSSQMFSYWLQFRYPTHLTLSAFPTAHRFMFPVHSSSWFWIVGRVHGWCLAMFVWVLPHQRMSSSFLWNCSRWLRGVFVPNVTKGHGQRRKQSHTNGFLVSISIYGGLHLRR